MPLWLRSPGPDQTDRLLRFKRLLDQARRGEPEAVSTLYRQFLPGVFGYIATRIGDRSTAEDLTAEVFLQMVEHLSRLRATEEAGFATWMLQIARTTVASYYRKREKQPEVVSITAATWEEEEGSASLALTPHGWTHDPARQAEVREEWVEVIGAINALTEAQRQVLVGRLILGYDVETVGRMLGKRGPAIRALQFRALERLQRLLQRKPPVERALPSRKGHQGGTP